MKIRQSFVSNSSSCSFCIAKVFMTDEQIKKFRDFLNFIQDYERDGDDGMYEFASSDFSKYVTENIRFCEGGIPYEEGPYFIGNIDQSILNPIVRFLTDMGISKEYIGLGD